MKKTDIITGSVLEIPLEKGFGYTYVKVIFLQDIKPDYPVDQGMVKPYNIFRKNPLPDKEFITSVFETDDLLLFPILLNGFPRIKGDKKWILKGNSKLTGEDKVIPDFIDHGFFEPLTQKAIKEACNSEYGCRVINSTNENGFVYIKDFESIKHLGKSQVINPDGIRMLLTMTWMNKLNENILNYYTESDIEKDFWIPIAYRQVIESDVDFSRIKFKGRLKIK